MAHFKITLAYDGTGFVGWQRQASGTSIQGLLEDALRELEGREVTVIGAGRTDAGVHALGQVASFSLEREIDAGVLVRAVNARLPPSVRVWSARQVPAGFHARFGARAKSYRYRISNGPVISPFDRQFAWHIAGRLDIDAMSEAAGRLEGRHDFAAFQAAGSQVATTERTVTKSRIVATTDAEDAGDHSHLVARPAPVRSPRSGSRPLTIDDGTNVQRPTRVDAGFDPGDLRVLRGERLIVYEITGDGFLRHMVRNIVGSLVEIGLGRRAAPSMDALIAARDRSAAGPAAPARGLFLVTVEYGELMNDDRTAEDAEGRR
jgi:tRNA pseudouridine38-40 synthase